MEASGWPVRELNSTKMACTPGRFRAELQELWVTSLVPM